MKKHILIFGASGSGTTTIASEVCKQLGYKHLDSDSYFWLPSKVPFTVSRPGEECLAMMEEDFNRYPNWILSGSITGWADVFTPVFDLVVFVYVAPDTRLERLKVREQERYGTAMLEGGDQYESTNDFLEWAMSYDDGTKNGRSLLKHETWLKGVTCKVLRITNNDLNDSINLVIDCIMKE